jgi:hypothetical protein
MTTLLVLASWRGSRQYPGRKGHDSIARPELIHDFAKPMSTKLPDEAKAACDAASLRHGVSGAIDSKDWIFWFLYDLAVFPSKIAAIDNYFADGADCARKLRSLIEEQRPVAGARILEFAAGWGRVTRHLRKVVPEAELLACDIHPGAVAFMREQLATPAVGSVGVPEQFDLGRRFDVVFVLSFFSHLPRSNWRRWLFALAAHTAPTGSSSSPRTASAAA